MKQKRFLSAVLTGAMTVMLFAGCGSNTQADTRAENTVSEQVEETEAVSSETSGALVIAEQGIFSAGGTTIVSDGEFDPENQWEETGAGQTAHVNVLYQIPEEETGLPMVFLHGYGQSRMGWMTTPDGREGWSDMFLRKGHSVFLIDEPHRGEAGATSVSGDISTKTLDQRWYTQFRIGRWENGQSVVNEGSQFPNDENSIEIEIYIKDSDTTYKMEQIYKQGVEQFVQFFLNDKFKSSKVEYHEKTKYILFEQI